MEGGRQADIAKGILAVKNVPYIVAAPLLIQVRATTHNRAVCLPCICQSKDCAIPGSSVASQDLASWSRDGIAGLQSVVLYSLPELDGAIDTVVRNKLWHG